MINDNRKLVRAAFGNLLTIKLGSLVSAVYAYQRGDFGGASPVVTVASDRSHRAGLTFRGSKPSYVLQVKSFVLYALQDGSWTEANCEDRLDDIETAIMEVVRDNQKAASLWESIDYDDDTFCSSVVIGGLEYRTEQIMMRFE